MHILEAHITPLWDSVTMDVISVSCAVAMLVSLSKARSEKGLKFCLAPQGPGKSVQVLATLRVTVGANERCCSLLR